jgi:ribonuclease HI
MPAAIVSVNDTRDDGEKSLWQTFTDGSKSEQGVGSGVAVFIGKVVTEEHKLKLDSRCSNNQAEHLAVVKALEVIEMRQVNHNEHRTVVIYTDIKITLDSIRSAKIPNHLVEEIRKSVVTVNKKNCKIGIKWVKAHVGNYGNKITYRLAKEATQKYHVTYSRVTKSAINKMCSVVVQLNM